MRRRPKLARTDAATRAITLNFECDQNEHSSAQRRTAADPWNKTRTFSLAHLAPGCYKNSLLSTGRFGTPVALCTSHRDNTVNGQTETNRPKRLSRYLGKETQS